MNSEINNNALSDILSLLDAPSNKEHDAEVIDQQVISDDPHIIPDDLDDSQNENSHTTQGFSIPDLLSLIDMASDFLGGKDEDTQNRLALLAALDPFIKTERKDKLDMAKTIVKISGLAKNFSKK